jgi:hypothetical protein
MFIKHVLGVGENHPGLYGNTSAYYGTIEQQGRLTLHLHLLLWLRRCLTPQEIRDRILDPQSDFQKKTVEYLESLCVGEFLTGQKEYVSNSVSQSSHLPDYKDPTCTLPDPPPPKCTGECEGCSYCEGGEAWWNSYRTTVDDILLRSNIHTHKVDKHGNDKSYCLNSKGECKRRFPRETYEQTMVDPMTGALNMKKGEPWMNTVTPELTYLLRSNSDVTSLLSGTSIKAVVAYVTDYIIKQSLKTYSVFDVIRSIFDKNTELISGDVKRKEQVRKILTQIVNSLTAKSEIGGPMASLYMLGNPDHYTCHVFVPFFWKGYVKQVMSAWDDEYTSVFHSELEGSAEKVVINKTESGLVDLSKIKDYMYRPDVYKEVCLFDWVRLSNKSGRRRMKVRKVGDAADNSDFTESDDDMDISKHVSEINEGDVQHGENHGIFEDTIGYPNLLD